MTNQFLLNNAIALTVATLLFTFIYIILLIKVCSALLIKKNMDSFNEHDKIFVASVIFTFLINLSSTVSPIYLTLQQSKYTFFNKDFTFYVISKAGYFVLIATIYSVACLIVVHLINSLINKDSKGDADTKLSLGSGILHGLMLIATALLFKQHLNVLISALSETHTIPIFN